MESLKLCEEERERECDCECGECEGRPCEGVYCWNKKYQEKIQTTLQIIVLTTPTQDDQQKQAERRSSESLLKTATTLETETEAEIKHTCGEVEMNEMKTYPGFKSQSNIFDALEEEDVQISELLSRAQDEKEKLEFVSAEEVYMSVIELQKQKYGCSSFHLASTYKKLASMFQKAKNLEISLHFYEEALAILTKTDTHSSREATCLVSISNIYLLKSDFENAHKYVNRAINICNTEKLEDEEMKPLLVSQALRLKRKIDLAEKHKTFEEKQIAFCPEISTCSICLEDIQINKRVRKLACGHIFHIKCIAEWLAQNPKCPYCRDVLPRNPTN